MRTIIIKTSIILLGIFSVFLTLAISAKDNQEVKTGNVIFIHPDGTALAGWNAIRVLHYGPDGELNWDRLSNIGLYQGHTTNTLTASSEAGATIHSYGVKVELLSYGMDGTVPLTSRSGSNLSIMMEAKSKGINIGIINSGKIVEPGTGVFVASDVSRANEDAISKKIIESGADLIFSGGEENLLPLGVEGKFGPGKRKDGLNVIELAMQLGYKVIYTKEELSAISNDTEKVLGIFARSHTFNDKSEEELIKFGLQNYEPESPTLAEMTDAAIKILSRKKGNFFLVVEEEGTDNFGNANNANGYFEALKRADDAIGVALEFYSKNPNTLIITASDSEAGGMEIYGFLEKYMMRDKPLPERANNGAPLDGINGTGTLPFLTAKDKNGNQFQFAVAWSTNDDVFGSVIAKAEGLNSELMKGKIDNTEIYRIMYAALFGKILE
ncbi:MAG TPA: alkaline phosphatase [Ignavibacteriaceae bacterium]|nr:alkaline phosphatase [Ignavibacteriaceae bacterium]